MEVVKNVASTENVVEPLAIQDWGLIDYPEALKRQMDHVALVHQELARETLVFCSHPPVVTLGRGTRPGDVDGWQGATVEVNRGGRATYHGPNQIVVYPIVDLNHRSRDLHRYLRGLEGAVVAALAEFGIQATGRSLQVQDGGGDSGSGSGEEAAGSEPVEATGVWIGSRKIASIGIGVRKWVTFHGLALNVDHDPKAFQGLKPCGFTPETMITMEEVIGARPDRGRVRQALQKHLGRVLAHLP
jgi:lipoyl(octanoyl) transferase